MSCNCQSYPPLPLDRKAILKRIKESSALKKRLEVVAEDQQLSIALFQCPVCGEMWQSGREWNLANAEYLFRVPKITAADWHEEHFQQPAAMMIYTASMAAFYARAPMTASLEICRVEGCQERALTVGPLCERHHIESLQNNRLLSKPPRGRLFSPYFEEPTRRKINS